MKFLCGNCKAKYQIPDEKVVGRTLRMKCRRCNHDILIDGHAMPAAAAAPARRPGGSSVSVMPPGPMRSGSGAGPLPARPAPPVPSASRSKPPSALNADFRRHVAAPPAVPARSAPYDLWHVAIQDVPVGPMTRDELSRKIEAGAVNAQSLSWREGMDDWRPMGELAELAALLRRSAVPAGGRVSVRPGRVPPAVPGPVGARPPNLYGFDDLDDDGSEPTRIADLTGGHPAVGGAGGVAAGHRAPAPASQPRVPAFVAAPVAASPAAEPVRAPQRQGMSSAALVTLGFSLCIVLLGGPLMVRTFWMTPAAPPAQATAVGPVQPKPEDRAARDVDVTVAPAETEEEKTTDKAPGKPGLARNLKATGADKSKEAGKDNLSDAERALLARMGGGDTAISDVARQPTGGGGASAPSGPALTANQLMKVVQNNRPALQRCYETALRSSGGKSDEAVKVTVEVVVGMSGTVKTVDTKGQGLGNMNDCLRQAVKRWRFPASGDESPFNFPVVFQPGA